LDASPYSSRSFRRYDVGNFRENPYIEAMNDTTAFLKASLEAGKDYFRPPNDTSAGALAGGPGEAAPGEAASAKGPPLMVPIRSLGANHRERIAAHLLGLDGPDRYLRFGYMANDEQIQRYVDSLNFERDEIFGIYNRKLELLAMAHLAYAPDKSCESCAEFGVSVNKAARGRGYGARLFDRAAMHARNDGIHLMFIHALTENTAMLKIARNAGATVERDGSETEAYLRLTPPTFDTRMTEMVEEQLAQADYQIKVQAKNFWDFLATAQQARGAAADARRDA
jgi:GNAT superfamily N-acetyltransferase